MSKMIAASEKNKSVKEKNMTLMIFVFLLLVLSILFFAYAAHIYFNAGRLGNEVGYEAGKAAGMLTGSFDGITEGLKEGAKEGKAEGLSAKDTKVRIGNEIKKIGKLEVLSASVVICNDLSKENNTKTENNTDYTSLIAFYGDITFTVDFIDAEIENNGDEINITLPVPELTLRLNDERTEQLATEMPHSWTGSNEDGYLMVSNSIDNIIKESNKYISNYDQLVDSAKSSAEKQVRFLVDSATAREVIVHVEFK